MTKKVFCLIFIIVLMCGCVNNKISINIDSDGVTFNNSVMFDEDSYSIFSDTINNINDEYKKNGYDVKIEKDGIYVKYNISKNYGKINKLSSKRVVNYNLVSYDNSNVKLFNKTNYILFSKYTSSFVIDYSDKDSINNIMSIVSNENESIDEEYYDEIIKLLDGISSNFVLNTKYFVGKNNSNSKSNNEYIWNLNFDSSNDISFVLYVPNTDLLLIIGVIIIFILIFSIIMFKRNRKLYEISKISITDSLKLEKTLYDDGNVVKSNIDSRDIDVINNRGRN